MLRIEIQIIHIADSAMVLTGCCDHKWVDATCTEPKTCTVCGETEGEALGHKVEKYDVTKEATCTEEGMEVGKCSVCKAEIEKKIDKTGHTEGDWEIQEKAKWKMCRELVLKSAQYVVR